MFTYNDVVPIHDDNCPFFFNEHIPSWYKIYNDGGHYIATEICHSQKKLKTQNHANEDIDILFDSLYYYALREGYNGNEMTDYIKTGIVILFADYPDLDGYIVKKIDRKQNNFYKRKKRFKRKAYINRWTHFVTVTFDDKKHTAETFRKTLRKCFSNLHTRRGWRYMGVFEYAPETGRLHFHAILYVPNCEMIGTITEKQDYDTRNGKMRTIHCNSFFTENFGRNDFEELNEMELKNGNLLNYLLKYISKTGDRIVYSRGIATVIYLKLKTLDIATEMLDYVTKYILFDDVVNWERDVMRFKYKQLSITDIMCNPLR